MVERSDAMKFNVMAGTPISKMHSPMTFAKKQETNKKTNAAAMKKLITVSIVSVFFISAQLYGGYIAGSIAIFTDSAHLASDMLGFAISMCAITMGQSKSTDHYSYGWHRAEVVGTLISISVIWVMTLWLLGEATKRFFEPPQVKGKIMLVVAVMGLIFNLIQMKILHSGDGHYHLGGEDCEGHEGHDHDHAHNHDHAHDHHENAAKNSITNSSLKEPLVGINDEHNHEGGCDHDHDHDHDHNHAHDRIAGEGDGNLVNTGNMNIDAAFLHVMGDMLMSVGVIIAALVITWNPNWWYADPICTYLFSVIVAVTTVPIIKNCVKIIMEGTPKNISLEMLTNDILNLDRENIIDVHDLHVWQIAQGRNTMSAHLKSKKPMKTLAQVTDLVRRKYNLHHTTVQVEGVEDYEANPHYFECGNDLHD